MGAPHPRHRAQRVDEHRRHRRLLRRDRGPVPEHAATSSKTCASTKCTSPLTRRGRARSPGAIWRTRSPGREDAPPPRRRGAPGARSPPRSTRRTWTPCRKCWSKARRKARRRCVHRPQPRQQARPLPRDRLTTRRRFGHGAVLITKTTPWSLQGESRGRRLPGPEMAARPTQRRRPASRMNPPPVAVLVVIFTVDDGQAAGPPHPAQRRPAQGPWSLPGGLLRPDESLQRPPSASWRKRPAC